MNKLVAKFSIIFPHVLSSAAEHEIVEQATSLQKDYSSDLSEAFPLQLATFAVSLKPEIQKLSSVQNLAHLLIVEYAAMTSGFTDVVILLYCCF